MQDRVCHFLDTSADVRFKIVTGVGDRDPISQQIQDGTLEFSPLFKLGFALMRSGHRVLDLGAHVGTFALAAASLGCQVTAVEASPYNASLLKDSAAQNGYEHLNVICAAVSDHSGMLEFIQAGPFGLVANPRVQSPAIEVPAVTVDELLDEQEWDGVDLVKMDIEGSEVMALRGMARLLGGSRAPLILYESNGFTLSLFGQTPKHLIAALAEFGYDSYLVEPGRLVPVGVDDLQADCNVDYVAARQPFVAPQGWQVDRPMNYEEIISRIVAACEFPHEHHRAYTARALAEASVDILSDRRVRRALNALKTDPHPDVREAASWWAADGSVVERRWDKLVTAVHGKLTRVLRHIHP